MRESLANLMGDGDAPAVTAPGLIVARKVTKNVRVSREGVLVVADFGGTVVRLKARDAVMIGQWLMAKGTEAKYLDGDNRRVFIEKGRNRT